VTAAGRRILAIDTATWTCAVALVRDGQVLAARAERTESSHAGTLPRLIDAVMAESGERLAAGDAVAVAIGPGSFTGLRIALSTAKGLAFAGGLAVVGVPTLDARALAAPPWEGRLCVGLDARKREIYAAVYEREDDRIVRVGAPCAIAASTMAGALAGRPCTVVGDAVEAYGDVFRAALGDAVRLLSSDAHPPSGAAVARLAAARLAAGPAGDDLVTLVPAYLRPPEAELTQSAASPSAPQVLHFVDKVRVLY
jgi:tRNA threonylcarbamoyladenosine biosynthesis protein TsaB